MIHEIEPHQYHVEYRDVLPKADELFLGFCKRRVVVRGTEDNLAVPTVSEIRTAFPSLKEEELVYLFSVDSTAFYTVLREFTEGLESEIYHLIDIRSMRSARPKYLAYSAATGHQIFHWYLSNRFCGLCGALLLRSKTQRMVYCPSCGNEVYPRINPSVIVGVLHEDKLLVTRYASTHVMYDNGTKIPANYVHDSLVAGYMEVGESPEMCVEREVREEVGLKVKNIRYYKSQPWPFSSALLLGYYCEVDGDPEVKLEEQELSRAVYLTREEMEDRSGEYSLTAEMMEAFRKGEI